MTRVREEALEHGTRRAALIGLSATGGVITSAGLVLAGDVRRPGHPAADLPRPARHRRGARRAARHASSSGPCWSPPSTSTSAGGCGGPARWRRSTTSPSTTARPSSPARARWCPDRGRARTTRRTPGPVRPPGRAGAGRPTPRISLLRVPVAGVAHLDRDLDRGAVEAQLLAQLALQEPPVAGLEEAGGEDDEPRRPDVGLGHVLDLRGAAAAGRRRRLLHQRPDERCSAPPSAPASPTTPAPRAGGRRACSPRGRWRRRC